MSVPAAPYYDNDGIRLLVGDARAVLASMPDGSVDCVVTSPPYYGLRDYGVPGQYGLEPTSQDFVDNLRAVFTELQRVLRPSGTVWLNLGDSYSATPPGRSEHPMRSSTLHGTDAAATLRASVRAANIDRTREAPRKNLLGIPWRVALALQGDGWVLRNAIVWAKPNPMPESVRDRLSTSYEHVFLLTRQPRYFFDLDAIRVPPKHPEALGQGLIVGGRNKGRHGGVGATARRRGHSAYGAASAADRHDGKYTDTRSFVRRPPGAAMRPTGRTHARNGHPRGKNPGDVWPFPTRPLRQAHFAAFPIDIPLRAIAAGSPQRGVVLDPFSGAATTGLAALSLGRRYVGIDINPAYHDIALRRLTQQRHGRRPA